MDSRKLVCLRTARVWDISKEGVEAGWLPYPVERIDAAVALIENNHPRVGVVLLDNSDPGWLLELESLLARFNDKMEWVGLVSPALAHEPPIRELLSKYLYDYHSLPVDGSRLLGVLGHAYGMASLRPAAQQSCVSVSTIHGCMIGDSPAMKRVFRQLEKLAAVDSSVMLRGESGTGKELAARIIYEKSCRANDPFVAVNCGAIPPNLIQSELFGHEKGSFTGACRRQIGHIEAANGGTLFLDEIGDLPLELQVNLLRFLQEKIITRVGGTEPIPVDVRVITATHRDLREEIREGRFREDLFYRLCVLDLELPPLRERRGDIELLAYYFLRKMGPSLNPAIRGFSASALHHMLTYDWPGNVRELKNRVERALVMCERRVIGHEDLELDLEALSQESSPLTLAEIRAEAEMRAMQHALNSSGNNVMAAARRLGISRVTLYRMMDKYKQLAS